jgi:peptidyl-prolyl cis-trans isomerase C
MLHRADGLEYCLRMNQPRGRRLALGAIALPVLFTVVGCPNLSAKRSADGKKGAVLAQIDDVSITVSELEDRLNSQTPYVRARYTGAEQKKEFLENLVKFEVLASEARRQGLDHDPEVVRAMKQVMIQKLLKQRFDRLKAEDITDDEVKVYFDGHQDEFNRPPEVRVSMILVPDEDTAKKVLADPRSRGLENVGFRDLVTQYSIDTDTKERGGDLRFFDERNRELPAELVAAAFKLSAIGDVSEPVKTKHGFAILKLTGQRRALTRQLAEVSQQIRAKLFRERRQRLMDEYERSLRQKSKVTVHDDKLSEVRVDLSKDIGAPEDLRPPKGTGSYHPPFQDAPQASPMRPGTPTTTSAPKAAPQ